MISLKLYRDIPRSPKRVPMRQPQCPAWSALHAGFYFGRAHREAAQYERPLQSRPEASLTKQLFEELSHKTDLQISDIWQVSKTWGEPVMRAALWVLVLGCLTGTAQAGDYHFLDRVGVDPYSAIYPGTPAYITERQQVVRFSEFDQYSRYPLIGCYSQEAPIRTWRGDWVWGVKITCY
jgi:hypothetical protein